MQEINQDKSKPVPVAQGKKKVLIFVVCYNAERSIEAVLDRIPKDIWANKLFRTEVLIINGQLPDQTFYAAEGYSPGRKKWYNTKNV